MYQSTYHWMMRESSDEINEDLIKRYNLSDINKTLLENRGFTTEDDLEKILNPSTHDFSLIYNIDIATNLILKHLENNSRILIYGDYDADGITSTTILYQALKKKSESIQFFIPNRIEQGYGLDYNFLENEVVGNFDLVITVDNGVSAIKEVELLKKNDIDVIIVDHHEFTEELPDAIIIHPNHPKGDYPCKYLAGVGITYKLIEALELDEEEYMQLVMIGTVADMVPMFDENKYFTINGLKSMNNNMNTGIKALLKEAGRLQEVDEETVGFTIAPRLNATGRIDEASLAVYLLLNEISEEASELAADIEMLNDARKDMVDETYIEAEQLVNSDNKIQVLYSENWHPGILGIVASRIVENYGVPAILLTRDQDVYTGSARSINTIELLKILRELNTEHNANGHNQAFGIKVDESLVEDFKVELTTLMNQSYSKLKPTKDIDFKITNPNITIKDLEELNELRPFGHGFLVPTVMVSNSTIETIRQIGVDSKHLKMTLKDYSFEVIGFNFGYLFNETSIGEKIYTIGRLGINEFNGIKKVQLVLEDAEIKDMQLFDMRSKNNQNFSIINKDTDTFFVAEDKEKLGSNYYHYGETIPYNVSQVILRDLPISMNNFETTLKELKPSKLIAIFDDKDNLFFSGIPKVQTIERVYNTIIHAENGAIDLKKFAPQLAKKHNITMQMLVKVTNTLEDLNRISVQNGVIFFDEENTEDLVVIESEYFKQLKEKLNSETQLKMTSRPELKTYIEKLINE